MSLPRPPAWDVNCGSRAGPLLGRRAKRGGGYGRWRVNLCDFLWQLRRVFKGVTERARLVAGGSREGSVFLFSADYNLQLLFLLDKLERPRGAGWGQRAMTDTPRCYIICTNWWADTLFDLFLKTTVNPDISKTSRRQIHPLEKETHGSSRG